jgi:hypothetical protein
MKKSFKLLVLFCLLPFVSRFYDLSQIGFNLGFSAKSVASGHFIDNRSQEMIEQGDNDIDY